MHTTDDRFYRTLCVANAALLCGHLVLTKVTMANQAEEQTPEQLAEELTKDREAKKQIVSDTIASLCNDASEFQDLRDIGAALNSGDSLRIKVLAGGATNYAYKVSLEKDRDKTLFAKICFKFALWNPDRSAHYDLSRVENEFLIMKKFKTMMDDAPVVTPYHCLDVCDMKLLVAEWAPADEQIANQFIDGSVDERVLPKAAKAFATLNCSDFDPSFNEECRPCMTSCFPLFRSYFDEYAQAPAKDSDKCKRLCQELGIETLHEIIDNMKKSYLTQECLIHSDSHSFNILVEKKPSIETLQQFGEKGSIFICDWEMAYAGPRGRDAGVFQSWPIGCAIAHSTQGRKAEAVHIFDCMVKFWDAYAATLSEKGKDEDYIHSTFRNALGWTAFFHVGVYYMFKLQIEHFPLEGASEEDRAKTLESCGFLGTKLFQIAFTDLGKDLSLEELRALYKRLVFDEIESLTEYASKKRRARPRRASVLRASGRRVSDAGMYDEAARRVSELSTGAKRRSILTDKLVDEFLLDIAED